jgi:GNAT superfamily N-acetyltransferase
MTMMSGGDGWRVRGVHLDDLKALVQLEARGAMPGRRVSRRSLRRSLWSPQQRVLVVEAGGGVVAQVTVWMYKRTWRVYNIVTDPAWRGRGVASHLMERVEREARRDKVSRVVLEAIPMVLPFLVRRGYHVVRRYPGPGGEAGEVHRMEKRLDGP